jgi:hypothetical protein
MMKNFKLPEIWFLILALLLALLGYSAREGGLTFNIHDAYFVGGPSHLFYLSASWVTLQSLIYWSIRKFKNKKFNLLLAFIHLFFLLLSFASPLIGFLYSVGWHTDVEMINNIITIGVVIHVLGLLIFITNTIITLRRS